MGWPDLLSPSRLRFTDDPDDETGAAFLDDKTPVSAAKHGTVIAMKKTWYWAMFAMMLTTILSLSFTISQIRAHVPPGPIDLWSEDILGKGQTKAIKYENSYNYSLRDSPEIRAIYKQYLLTEDSVTELFLQADVAIPVHDPAKYDLGRGYTTLKDPAIPAYLPSYIHQFHCLAMVRGAWWDIRDRYENGVSRDDAAAFAKTQRAKWVHLEHCIDYIRQMIKCNADTTLEGPVRAQGHHINDGTEAWRKCYDMEDVFERHRKFSVPISVV